MTALGFHCFVWVLSGLSEWGYSSLWCTGFSLHWLLLLQKTGSSTGLSSCGSWAQQLRLVGCRAWAQSLWCMGLVAPRHRKSSQTRDQTCVPCIGRQILILCATREVLNYFLSTLNKWYIIINRKFRKYR